jgi:hypothetical protein
VLAILLFLLGIYEAVLLGCFLVGFNALLSFLDILIGNHLFLSEPGNQEGQVLANESIQNAIVLLSYSGSKFVDSVAEHIGVWSTKLMPEGFQKPDELEALSIGPLILAAKAVHPVQHWNAPILFLVKENVRGWHRHTSDIVILRYWLR